tara:strand:- start:62 stop:316 length:255 start_codon:yes stop_codon:yes gene_type:complete
MIDVIKYPVSTEKNIKIMEAENKLIFVVNKKANKRDVKEALEKMYKIKVLKVNTLIDHTGRKKAFVKLDSETPAIDLATKLGIM